MVVLKREVGLQDYISDDVIAEVRDKADIVQVISEYLPLKKWDRWRRIRIHHEGRRRFLPPSG